MLWTLSELLDSGEKMNFQLNPVLGEKSITLLLNECLLNILTCSCGLFLKHSREINFPI